MANEIIDEPNSPPTLDADWDDTQSKIDVSGKGQNSVSLTNWASGNTTVPAIASGSTIEINGAFAQFASETAVSTSGLSSGTVYVYIDVTTSAGDALPKFTNTAPTWSDSKGGWYGTGGTLGDRYTGHVMEWDGATSYSEKAIFDNDKTGKFTRLIGDNAIAGELLVQSIIDNAKTRTFSAQGGSSSAVTLFPRGLIYVRLHASGSGWAYVQCYDGTTWQTIARVDHATTSPVITLSSSITIFSDGTNYRWQYGRLGTGSGNVDYMVLV